MTAAKKLKVIIKDPFNEVHEIIFKRHEYRNLMDLIINTYYEEIGDCGGRGLCGTCHVQLVSGIIDADIDMTEAVTLNTLCDTSINSRLACQIMLDEKINERVFTIINNN